MLRLGLWGWYHGVAGKAANCNKSLPYQLVSVPTAPLTIQYPVNRLRKALENDPSVWAPTTHMEDLEEAPSSSLVHPGLWLFGESTSRWKISILKGGSEPLVLVLLFFFFKAKFNCCLVVLHPTYLLQNPNSRFSRDMSSEP